MAEIWTNVTGYSTLDDIGESDLVEIDTLNKSIPSINFPTLYRGEKYSNPITFIIDKYLNGIDITSTTRKIQIGYKVNGLDLISNVINVKSSDSNRVKFTWLPEDKVTYFVGRVPFSVKIVGTNSNGTLMNWSTDDVELTVEESVNPYIDNNSSLLNTYTLSPSNWVASGSEYTYTITINGVTEKNEVIISPACTGDAYTALRDADIYYVECGKNYVKLYASGYKPTIETKVKVVVQ